MMNGWARAVTAVWGLGLLTGLFAAVPGHGQTLPALDVLPAGEWTTLRPGGDTGCALGTPYSFHVKPGARERLMIFLNGGGACWTGDQCDPSVEPTPYVPSADLPHNDPRTRKGAFDLHNPENPFTEWSQVFVSYCTGDVHLGSADQDYARSDGTKVTIRHRGKANVQAALDWVRANFDAPERVFVGGGSAGAVSSAYWAGVVQDAYPGSEVIQYGGGGGGYRAGALTALFDSWGVPQGLADWPEWEKVGGAPATFEDFYRVTAARYPEMRFHQFNTAHDAVQAQFVALLKGKPEPLFPLLKANLAELSAQIPTFRSYTAPGDFHTLLRFDALYRFETAGVRAVDWITDIAAGRTVANVSCEDDPAGCGAPPAPQAPAP